MKRNVCIMALLFIVSSFSMKLAAQENLNALVKKCETMESVDINYVREKNSQTNQLETKIISIIIRENQALINEILNAFKKDEVNATQAIENRKGGEIYSLFYQFKNVAYSFNFSNREKGGYATLTVLY